MRGCGVRGPRTTGYMPMLAHTHCVHASCAMRLPDTPAIHCPARPRTPPRTPRVRRAQCTNRTFFFGLFSPNYGLCTRTPAYTTPLRVHMHVCSTVPCTQARSQRTRKHGYFDRQHPSDELSGKELVPHTLLHGSLAGLYEPSKQPND